MNVVDIETVKVCLTENSSLFNIEDSPIETKVDDDKKMLNKQSESF